MKYSREQKLTFILSVLIIAAGLVIYWTSAYPSVTWWESSEYSTAALTFGIIGPPGSLLLTIFGWVVCRLPADEPAYLLNLSSGLLAALAVVITFLNSEKISKLINTGKKERSDFMGIVILLLSAAVLLCSVTLWQYAVMFTPYILTGVFTALILSVLIKWWRKADEKDSWKEVLLLTLLLGADFSVHRTNAVMIPGIVIVMLIRKAGIFLDWRSYLAAFAGFFSALSLQLLYIPIARTDPYINLGDPSSLKAFWSFFSLEQYGGNFLLDIFTRKAPFFGYQVPYYLKALGDNFFYTDTRTIITGFIPGILGIAGIISYFRRNRRFGTAMLALFLITALASVVYFNLPQNYFRTIYRHYIPTFIIFSVFVLEGAGYLYSLANKADRRSVILKALLAFILLFTFVFQYSRNITKTKGTANRIAEAYAGNFMKSLDEDAILFSYGDHDLFPFLYIQASQKMRPDVIHLNLSLLNLSWYLKQSMRHHPDLPFRPGGSDLEKIEYRDWKPVAADLHVPEKFKENQAAFKDSIRFELPALREGRSILLQDFVLFNIVVNNSWNRPVYLSRNGLEGDLYNWLKPYLIDEGLVYRLVPAGGDTTSFDKIASNLESFDFAGFSDLSVRLDETSVQIGNLYFGIFLRTIEHLQDLGENEKAALILDKLLKDLPPARINPEDDFLTRLSVIKTKLKK